MSEPAAKKLKVDEIPNHLSTMDETCKKNLVDIDNVQSQLDKLSEDAAEEILKIEQKFNKSRQPLYARRNTLIQLIPAFWATAFLNHPQLSAMLSEHEEELIGALKQVEVEEFEDIKSGYKIILTFTENEYFDTERIEKTYNLSIEQPVSTTSSIKWKAGRQPAKTDLAEGQPVTFVEWLNENIPPDSDEIAEVIKDDLFPNPLQYYLMPDVDEGDEEFNRFLEEDAEDEETLDEVYENAGSDADAAPDREFHWFSTITPLNFLSTAEPISKLRDLAIFRMTYAQLSLHFNFELIIKASSAHYNTFLCKSNHDDSQLVGRGFGGSGDISFELRFSLRRSWRRRLRRAQVPQRPDELRRRAHVPTTSPAKPQTAVPPQRMITHGKSTSAAFETQLTQV
ncbi:unnamed protein product [Caenorhabditis auriculariae]|uniref:Uncharacterized protein n=1 Tax=Caenorhabditis auriculariae TaxID=2777116 RepID=A0A8S1HY97_9PELO|nr:unnamed protein product [Caenorhabditis auriculariae]